MAQYSVFGSAPPPWIPTAYTDGTPNIRLGSGFYVTASGYRCIGGRVYFPPGSFDGETVEVYAHLTGIDTAVDYATVPFRNVTTRVPIGGGWVEVHWVPFEMEMPNPGVSEKIVYISYQITSSPGGYLHVPGVSVGSTPTPSVDVGANLVLMEARYIALDFYRSRYRIGSAATENGIGDPWYGVDILVDSAPTLVSHFDFHEGSGSTATSIISPHTLSTSNPATAWDGQAAAGGGAGFEGDISDGTISEWSLAIDVVINSQTAGYSALMYHKNDTVSPADTYVTWLNGVGQNKMQFWRTGGDVIESNTEITFGVPARYVIVASLGGTKLFLNGKLVASDALHVPWGNTMFSTTKFPDPTEPFDGKITAARFWNGALTDIDVEMLPALQVPEPTAYFDFHEGSGSQTASIVGSGVLFADTPATAWSGQAASGNGGPFTTWGQYESFGVTDGTSTSEWTVVCDVQVNSLNGGPGETIFSHNQVIAPVATYLQVDQTDGRVAITRTDLDTIGSTASLVLGQMHRLAIVCTATDMRLYIDGVLEGSKSTPTPFEESGWSSPTRIPWTTALDGIVDNVRFWPNALNMGEITALGVPAAMRGKVKVWNGSAWSAHPLKVWDGSSWVVKPAKGWDGAGWVEGKPD